jgi:hypothetical protein
MIITLYKVSFSKDKRIWGRWGTFVVVSKIAFNCNFFVGHFEHPPYSEDTRRSAYHVRALEIFRLKQVKCLQNIIN